MKLLKEKKPQVNDMVMEYDRLRVQSKILKDRMDYLSKEIKAYATKNGVQDDKGTYHCENEMFEFGSQAKKSISFIEDKAISFFKSHKLFDAIKTVETIDDEAVEQYIATGDVTFEDLENITQTKTTYAIFLKPKEEVPVVEEVPLKSVASTKSRFKGR